MTMNKPALKYERLKKKTRRIKLTKVVQKRHLNVIQIVLHLTWTSRRTWLLSFHL